MKTLQPRRDIPGTLIAFSSAIHLIIGAAAGTKGPIKVIRLAQWQQGALYAGGIMSIIDVLQPRKTLLIIPPGELETIKGGTE